MRLAHLAVAAGLVLAATAASASAHPEEEGKERWAVKTAPADLTPPAATPIATLIGLPNLSGVRHNDARYQAARIPTAFLVEGARAPLFEGRAVATTGWLHLVAAETDGDFHIQLSASPTSGSPCLIVEIPDPKFIADPVLKAQAVAARAWIAAQVFHGHAPARRGSIVKTPVRVRVTGALFFDDSHVGDRARGKKGMKAGTLWELHPVTAIGPAS